MKGTVALIHLLFVVSSVQAQFAGGDGSQANPYQIETVEQLQQIRYQKGEGGYTAFRIPGLVVSNQGTLIAISEARYATWQDDLAEDDIAVKRSEDGGKTWGPLIIAASDGRNTLNDPVPVVLPSGRILIMYNWNEPVDKSQRGTREIYLIHSDDDGKTWSEPRNITSMVYKDHWGWYGTGPGHGIVLEQEPYQGRVIIPAMHNPAGARGTSHILYSDDDGETWHIGAITPGERRGESTAVELSNGHVMLNSRDHNDEVGGPPYRYVAISDDGGESFYTSYYDSTLIEPAAMGSILKHSVNPETGKYNILFSNPHSTERGVRVCGTLKLSEDDGATWSRMMRYSDPYPRFSSYSDITVINEEGDIGILFETGPHYDNPVRWDGIVFKVVSFSDIDIPIDDPDYCSPDWRQNAEDAGDYVFVFDGRGKHYVQTADIDASETEYWNNRLGFEPIGIHQNVFKGIYDGNGYKISNLTINRMTENEVGLFGVAGGYTIKNVTLENVNIRGRDFTGGLVGRLRAGEVSNSSVTGIVSGERRVGGLVGQNRIGTIRDSHAEVEVTGQRDVGGLVGENEEGGTVIGCSATGDASTTVDDGHDVGGLVGANRDGSVFESFATGNVSARGDRAGGLVGQHMNAGSAIADSYATGNVSGREMVGGLVGRNRQNATVWTSYSTGKATGELARYTAAFVGLNIEGGALSNSYWDVESSGTEKGAGPFSADGISGLVTAQMTGRAALANMAGFDFDKVWVLNEGYPALHWEDVEALPTNIEPIVELPEYFRLEQNYPNPFNPSTSIEFSLPKNSKVTLEIFTVQGQYIATLMNGIRDAGVHTILFDASNLASGLYMYRIRAEGFAQVKKMLLVK